MNGPRFTAPSLPWWSPIQVLIGRRALTSSERATELALVATASDIHTYKKIMLYHPGTMTVAFILSADCVECSHDIYFI